MDLPTTMRQYFQFADKYKNWGRWGQDDEVGTLNFVKPEHIVAAARLVRKGKVFSLAIPLDEKGPQVTRAGSRRFNPIHTMLKTGTDHGVPESAEPPVVWGTDDMITMPLQAATQWDGFGHIIFRGRMYNGRPGSMVTGQGALKNGIEKLSERVIGRGVLLDIPRHRGVPWVGQGDVIDAHELDACAAKRGVKVGEGDFLLVRTGNIAMYRSRGGWGDFVTAPRPGIGLSVIPWLYDKRVASVACDNFGVEVDPGELTEMPKAAVHCIALAHMGMLFGEIFDLEKLADDCAQDGVYEFLFVAPPMPVTGGVGSPVNPYAVK